MVYRFKAFLLHLLVSAMVAIVCVLLVYRFWYPSPLDVATGVTKIFLILLICDAILGPVLTFVIADHRKKSLKLDLSVIAVIQVSALCYGMWTVEAGRPVWLVFSVDRFDLVQSHELDNPYREKALPQYQGKNWSGPQWVAARLPSDVEDLNTLTFEALMAGVDVPQRPDLYVELAEEMPTILDKALPLSDLRKFNADHDIDNLINTYPAADVYLPMMSRAKQMTVLIDSKQSKIISVVDLMPWE